MINRIHTLLAIFALFLSQFVQAQKISFDKIPDWVKEVEIPEKSSFSQYDVLSGYYFTLADYQVNLEKNSSFNREVRNVLSYGGITNASQIAVTYDTSYQRLHIHHLVIWRKGKKIDLTDSLTFEFMNNEQNLDQGLYLGKITAYDILNDIRKNDLIDFAYTLEGDNPIFNNEKYLFVPLAGLNPIDLYSIRVLFLKNKNYTYHYSGSDSIISKAENDTYQEINIIKHNVPAIKYEDNMPTWQIPYDYITLSSFNSWNEVNKWAQEVFSLKSPPVLNHVFEEIFTGSETTDEKINKIIDYVQDDIRYMGIESGIGSIKPFPPEQVVKKRYGDCKDKSLLMVSLLKMAGIEKAYPALVNTYFRDETGSLYPSNQIFNHCIVTFEYQNRTYWVDPTIAMQGGDYHSLYCPNYGDALIIGDSQDSLYTMHYTEIDTSVKLTEELTVHSFTEPAILNMTSVRYNIEADTRRLSLNYYTTDAISEGVTKQLKLLYPEVTPTQKVKFTDDTEKNTFTSNYYYQVDGFMHDTDTDSEESFGGIWVFKYEPLSFYEYLNLANCSERKYHLQLSYPFKLNCHFIFHFPQDLYINDSFEQVENEAYILEKNIEQTDIRTIQVNYSLEIKSNVIENQDFVRICEQTKEVIKELPILFYFYK